LSRGEAPLYLLFERGARDRRTAIAEGWQIDEASVERCLAVSSAQ
jgi:hypothetical protein